MINVHVRENSGSNLRCSAICIHSIIVAHLLLYLVHSLVDSIDIPFSCLFHSFNQIVTVLRPIRIYQHVSLEEGDLLYVTCAISAISEYEFFLASIWNIFEKLSFASFHSVEFRLSYKRFLSSSHIMPLKALNNRNYYSTAQHCFMYLQFLSEVGFLTRCHYRIDTAISEIVEVFETFTPLTIL